MRRLSPRALAAFPFVFTALAALLLATVGEAARPTVLSVEVETAKLAAMIGLGAAALTFDRTDYLRRGWGLSAACYALLLARDAWLFASPGPGSEALETARGLLVVVGNGCLAIGTWSLSRAFERAGLEYTASPSLRRGVIALAVVAALLFAGPAVWFDARAALGPGSGRWWPVASDLGDMLALPLLAPVVLTALAVRHGSLRWPWALLAASLLAWLLYDAALTIPDVLHLEGRAFRFAGECFRMFAATAACGAGLAQRRAVVVDDDDSG